MVTSLILHCVAWIVQAVALTGLCLKRQPSTRPVRWVFAGLLAFTTSAIPDDFGHYRHWPASQLAVTGIVQIVLTIAGIACAVIAIALRMRSQRTGQMRDRSGRDSQRTSLHDLLRTDENSQG